MKRIAVKPLTATQLLAAVAGTVICFGMIASAHAAPLEAGDVSAEAKWFVHIDFDAARDSKVGQFIHQQALKDERIKAGLAKVESELGLDLQKDLHGATLYGTTFTPHTGVLIVYAHADGDKFMAHIKARPDFIALKTVDGEQTIYTWTEQMGHKPMAKKPVADGSKAEKKTGESKESGPKSGDGKTAAWKGHAGMSREAMAHGMMMHHPHKQTVWAAFPKPDMAVFADSAVDLKAALDVIGGKGGLTASSPLLPEAPKGTVFSGAAAGLSAIPFPAHFPVLKQLDSISYVGGETDGEDFDHVKVTMANPTVVTQLKSILEGLQAMGQLHLAGHPEAMKMIDGMKVEADAKTLTIDWKASSGDVIKFVEKACEFIHKHHEAKR